MAVVYALLAWQPAGDWTVAHIGWLTYAIGVITIAGLTIGLALAVALIVRSRWIHRHGPLA